MKATMPLGRAAACAAALVILFAAASARAQTVLVVPTGPGTQTDTVARVIAGEMGPNVATIRNVPGAAQGTALADARNAKAPRDGQTIFLFRGGDANTSAEIAQGLRELLGVALVSEGRNGGFIGAFVPQGTSAAAIARAEALILQALSRASVRERLSTLNQVPGGDSKDLASVVKGGQRISTPGAVASASTSGGGGSATSSQGGSTTARSSGNLPKEVCQRENRADPHGYVAKLGAINDKGSTLYLRGSAAALKWLIEDVYRKCDGDPEVRRYIESLKEQRAAAIRVCTQISSSNNCEVSPF